MKEIDKVTKQALVSDINDCLYFKNNEDDLTQILVKWQPGSIMSSLSFNALVNLSNYIQDSTLLV